MPRPCTAFCCTITPFDENGKLDEEALAWLLARIGAAGVGAFLGTASPGEGHALDLHETERLYTVAKETLGGKVPVRAMGREPRTAKDLLELIRVAEGVGIDAMQLYSIDLGHSQVPTNAELERYFRTLLESMRIPAVLSSHHFGGYTIPPDMYARLLADYDHLIGINCTSPNMGYVVNIIDISKDRADVHVGGPMQAIDSLFLGAQGFLSSEAILVPGACATVVKGFESGDYAAMGEAYARIIRLFSQNVWPGASVRYTKAAMKILGMPGYHLRPPFIALDEAAHTQLEAGLRGLHNPEIDVLFAKKG